MSAKSHESRVGGDAGVTTRGCKLVDPTGRPHDNCGDKIVLRYVNSAAMLASHWRMVLSQYRLHSSALVNAAMLAVQAAMEGAVTVPVEGEVGCAVGRALPTPDDVSSLVVQPTSIAALNPTRKRANLVSANARSNPGNTI